MTLSFSYQHAQLTDKKIGDIIFNRLGTHLVGHRKSHSQEFLGIHQQSICQQDLRGCEKFFFPPFLLSL